MKADPFGKNDFQGRAAGLGASDAIGSYAFNNFRFSFIARHTHGAAGAMQR